MTTPDEAVQRTISDYLLDGARAEAQALQETGQAAEAAGCGVLEIRQPDGGVELLVCPDVPAGHLYVAAGPEERALAQVRRIFAAPFPDPAALPPADALRSTGTYRRALLCEHLLELGHAIRRGLPGPLRRLLGG